MAAMRIRNNGSHHFAERDNKDDFNKKIYYKANSRKTCFIKSKALVERRVDFNAVGEDELVVSNLYPPVLCNQFSLLVPKDRWLRHATDGAVETGRLRDQCDQVLWRIHDPR